MRLFVALEIPSEVRENLVTLLRELRAVDPRPRWVRAENLHVTLKFIGHMAPERLEAIRGALETVRSSAPVTLDFHGLGFFPNEKRPRVFWAAMGASPNLARIVADIETNLEKIGIPREQREFSPHLTLARFDDTQLSKELVAAIQKQSALEFGAFETWEFYLYESKLKHSGAEYVRLMSFPFVAEGRA